MCAVKAQIPKEKLVSVATGSGKHTSVHSNREQPEMSRTKGIREKMKWGKTQIKKIEWSGSLVNNEQLECQGC